MIGLVPGWTSMMIPLLVVSFFQLASLGHYQRIHWSHLSQHEEQAAFHY